MACDRPQPAAETIARPIAAKGPDLRRHRLKGFLKDVGNILAAELPTAAPLIDERPVDLHELLPRILVARPDALQKGHRSGSERLSVQFTRRRVHEKG